MLRNVILISAVVVTLGQSGAVAQSGEVEKGGRLVRTQLDARISPAIDLHFFVRALSVEDRPVSVEGMLPAIEAARTLNEKLGEHLLRWGPIEGALVKCQTVSEVVAAFEKLPETFGPRQRTPGKAIKLRESAVRYANALQNVEPYFVSSIWPEHNERLAALRQRLLDGLGQKQATSFEFMMKHLNMTDPAITIPVYLVFDAPFPGAFTQRGWDGKAVCFVGSQNVEGSQLYETVLHEATHALDVATAADNVFATLRDKLTAAGLSRRDHGFRDVPHTLMFVHTAETVRRILDPEHKDYGDTHGYYKRAPKSTDAVRQHWVDYLDGKITQDEALDRIVRDFVNNR
ncbi:MAG: hypothetical protein PVI86_12145 [Phycisphaerae bacterium]|jgi:hypothetical protein